MSKKLKGFIKKFRKGTPLYIILSLLALNWYQMAQNVQSMARVFGKLMIPITKQFGGIEITAKANKKSYSIGDVINFRVSLSKPAFLRVYELNESTKKLSLIYPDSNHSKKMLDRGEHLIPTVESDWEFIAGPPTGKYRWIFVASEKPFIEVSSDSSTTDLPFNLKSLDMNQIILIALSNEVKLRDYGVFVWDLDIN